MLIVISPAKRLDWTARPDPMTRPDFLEEANSLARTMRNRSLTEIKRLMSLSDDLARLNRDRFRAFSDDPEDGDLRPAVLAFAGDTYQGLDAGSFGPEDQAWAGDRLRILSGLYGLLRPFDGIQPYRLEMGTRLHTRRGESLYDYWRDIPARALNAQAEATGTGWLLNCASQEYFGAVDRDRLNLQVISPVFLEDRDGKGRVVSFFAKKARGAMARFAITNRITDPAGLEAFDLGGYRFDPEGSAPGAPCFRRPYQAAAAAS
ncbi:peroxide stress protein YaaA [Pseudooceanicola sp. C21-150M6]|uniref:peroxide stress protein YaaA n=1 Tax=Pseudooceanicola sp. C21-150M6 TaxID=3434355 RepID=UPI003D7FE356